MIAKSEYFKQDDAQQQQLHGDSDQLGGHEVIMDKIVNYLFSGKMKINYLSSAQLLKLSSMLGMLVLEGAADNRRPCRSLDQNTGL